MRVPSRVATILGFLVAPWVAAAGVFVSSGRIIGYDSAIGLIPLFYLYSLGFAVVLGAPSYYLMRRYGRINGWSTLLAGVLIGVVVATIVNLPYKPRPHALLICSLVGGISTFVFWMILAAWRPMRLS